MYSAVGKKLYRLIAGSLLGVLVVIALGSLGGRLFIANIDFFRGQIERALNDMGIRGFSVDRVSGHWDGLHPVLTLSGAALNVPGRSQSLHVDELALSVDLLDSLMRRDVKIGALRATVSKLILVKDEQARWWLNDMRLFSGQGNGSGFDFYTMFKRLPHYVSVDVQLIQINDLSANQDYLIQNSLVQSHLVMDQLDLSFSTNLPSSLGARLQARFLGNQKQQRLYLSAADLNPAQVAALAGYSHTPLRDTRLSFESWGSLEAFSLQAVTTRLHQASVVLQNGERVSQAIRFAADQKIERSDQGWRVDTHIKRAFYRDQGLPAFFSTAYFSPAETGPVLAVDEIELGAFVPVLADLLENGEQREMLLATSPSLRILDLVARLDPQALSQSALGFNFENLRSSAYADLPGIESLSGQFSAAAGQLSVALPEQPLSVAFKSLFRQPLNIDRFSARLHATVRDSETLLSIEDIHLHNQDVTADGRAWVEFHGGQAPFMSLRLSYRDGRVASTGKYLPVSIMPLETVKWLDRSIKGGAITQGGLLFHGRLRNLWYLEKEQAGVFHALFDIRDPEVDFLPHWPRAHRGQGQASFYNLGMALNFTRVRFASSLVEDVDISIADFFKPDLVIRGRSRGDANSLLDTLASLPDLEVFDVINANRETAKGDVDARIDIVVPLRDDPGQRLMVKATADLDNVELRIPDWSVDFTQVNGVLSVENQNVSAPALSALYAGDRVDLTVSTNIQAQRTDFSMQGQLHTRNLLRLTPAYISQPVSGKSPWAVNVSVFHAPEQASQRVQIQASSSLEGTAIDAPAPLRVAAGETLGCQIEASLGLDYGFKFNVGLANRARARGYLTVGDAGDLTLDYLDLNFGDKVYRLKDNGVNLTGDIQQLDIDEWSRFQQTYLPKSTSPSDLLEQIKSIELSVADLHWQGREAHKLNLNVNNRGDRLAGDMNSSMARGVFELPFETGQARPIRADFDYIRLRKKQGDSDSGATPELRDMPNLALKAKVLAYEDMVFSDFVLNTVNEADRFIIKRLDLKRDEVALQSSGYWQYSEEIDKHVTVFNIQVQGKQFGAAISNLGLGESIRNAAIDFEGQIGWAGRLFDISWPSLIGEVRLSLKDGYLNNVEPGAGRFVGLLSLNALPKRLFLDFGDVLNEGMQFDEISGDFKIKGELMTTENATMNGSSARVELVGETNIRHKTYNQHMVITPKIGETLPVLGSLAAGNAVGWGLLLLQKIFKKPIEKSVQIEYNIGGSWDDPRLTLISKPVPEESGSDLLNEF